MKAIVVGDLHGNLNFYRAVKNQFPDRNIILVGDLLDSFLYDVDTQVQLLQEVLADIRQKSVRCLIGNHELNYMYTNTMRCSGFNGAMAAQTLPLLSEMHAGLENFIFEDNVLITHAGLSKRFFSAFGLGSETVTKEWLEDMCSDLHGPMYFSSHARGGSRKYAGIFWCDWTLDFEPIEGLVQIFGHTGISCITKRGDSSYNIDCIGRSNEVLEINGKTITYHLITY